MIVIICIATVSFLNRYIWHSTNFGFMFMIFFNYYEFIGDGSGITGTAVFLISKN